MGLKYYWVGESAIWKKAINRGPKLPTLYDHIKVRIDDINNKTLTVRILTGPKKGTYTGLYLGDLLEFTKSNENLIGERTQ